VKGTLTDAGPLVALLDADEQWHEACVAALDHVTLPLVMTWPAFTEVIYLLDTPRKASARVALWTMVDDGRLVLADIDESMRRRSRALMEQYEDLPMDLADATLVALAEREQVSTVFSVDTDFDVYSLPGKKRFERFPLLE